MSLAHPIGAPKENTMSSLSGAAGHAALAICESMLLSLTERKVIDEREARAILEDAAAAHRNAMPLSADSAAHDEVASLIEAMLKEDNMVRRS
jgi:hypothetical protein